MCEWTRRKSRAMRRKSPVGFCRENIGRAHRMLQEADVQTRGFALPPAQLALADDQARAWRDAAAPRRNTVSASRRLLTSSPCIAAIMSSASGADPTPWRVLLATNSMRLSAIISAACSRLIDNRRQNLLAARALLCFVERLLGKMAADRRAQPVQDARAARDVGHTVSVRNVSRRAGAIVSPSGRARGDGRVAEQYGDRTIRWSVASALSRNIPLALIEELALDFCRIRPDVCLAASKRRFQGGVVR